MTTFANVEGTRGITPSLEEKVVDVAAFETAKVSAITSTLLSQLDSDFVAENIKKDVDLFGLMGTMEAGGGGDRIFGRLLQSGTITPSDDITDAYVIKFPKTFGSLAGNSAGGKRFNFVLWCENTSNPNLSNPNSSWVVIAAGRVSGTQTFTTGTYLSSSGKEVQVSAISESAELNVSKVTIYCSSVKRLVAGRTYNWLAVANDPEVE